MLDFRQAQLQIFVNINFFYPILHMKNLDSRESGCLLAVCWLSVGCLLAVCWLSVLLLGWLTVYLYPKLEESQIYVQQLEKFVKNSTFVKNMCVFSSSYHTVLFATGKVCVSALCLKKT